MPTLFVVGGTNGVGKTTIFKQIIPSGVDYINADLIAEALREKAVGRNIQDLANSEATKVFEQRVLDGQSFAIESNLFKQEDYKAFLVLKTRGYTINIIYFAVDNVETCIKRVAQRVTQGGHHVNADVIRDRYVTGLSLLKHYKKYIDKLTLLDNSGGNSTLQARLENGLIIYQNPEIAIGRKKFYSHLKRRSKSRSLSKMQEGCIRQRILAT